MSPPATIARKPRHRTREMTGLRREEIIQAAIKVFSRNGFQAARAEDIAHAAKIAKGTLYLYFRSKEELYSAAIAQAAGELQALSTERVEATPAFREKLAIAVSLRLQFWSERPALYRLLMTLGREPRHRRQTNELLRAGQQQLLAIFEAAGARKELKPGDYAPLAWAILDMIRGANERRIHRESETTVEGDTKTITALAFRAAGV